METQDNNIEVSNAKTFSTKRLILAAGILVALIVVGAVLVRFTGSYFSSSSSNPARDSQSSADTERRLANESNLKNLATASDVRVLSGTVVSIDGNSLTVRLQVNPSGDQSLNDRTVLINADTKLVKFLPSTTSPGTYDKIIVDSTSIKASDYVTAIAGENIKTLKEFTATGIQIMSKSTTQ